jgi:hypothetical protein
VAGAESVTSREMAALLRALDRTVKAGSTDAQTGEVTGGFHMEGRATLLWLKSHLEEELGS